MLPLWIAVTDFSMRFCLQLSCTFFFFFPLGARTWGCIKKWAGRKCHCGKARLSSILWVSNCWPVCCRSKFQLQDSESFFLLRSCNLVMIWIFQRITAEQEARVQTQTQEVSFAYEEKKVTEGGEWALKQVAQRRCGVWYSGDSQNLPRCGPVECVR